MINGLKLTDAESGNELCRIWLSDGIIHTSGDAMWIEDLLNRHVGIGDHEVTSDEGPDWLDAIYQSYTSPSTLSLDPFDPTEQIQKDAALGELNDHT